MGLCRRQRLRDGPRRRAGPASDGQAGGAGRGRDPRLLEARRHRARCLLWLRHHADRDGARHLILEGKRAGRKGWRLPAADLEGLVTVRLRDWLADAAAISAVIDGDPQEASAHASLITQAQSLADRWPELKPHQAKAYLNALLRRVIVESARIVIEIDGERALATLLAGPDVVSIKRSRQDAQPAKHPIILDIPIALKRAGTGMKLVVPGARNNAKCAPGLIRLLLRAFAIQDRLEQNPDLTLQRIAEARIFRLKSSSTEIR